AWGRGGEEIRARAREPSGGGAGGPHGTERARRGGITADDLEKAAGADLKPGERLLLRTDCNQDYDGSMEWQQRSPYLTNDAIDWCLAKRVVIVGFDMYHGADAPGSNVIFNTSRR